MLGVLIRGGEIKTQAWRKDTWSHREDGHLQVRESGPRDIDPADTLLSDFQPPGL